MNIRVHAATAVTLGTLVCLCSAVNAQAPQRKNSGKASAPAPFTKPLVTGSFVSHSNALVVPKKPPVVTAVAPHIPVTGPGRSIIFVGGKPQSGGNAALNPQPIPPGHVSPGDPIR